MSCPRSKTIDIYPYFPFNATAISHIHTLSLHDALPISAKNARKFIDAMRQEWEFIPRNFMTSAIKFLGRKEMLGYISELKDRKSTRLNSSHLGISYAVFCLKKKTKGNHIQREANPAISG